MTRALLLVACAAAASAQTPGEVVDGELGRALDAAVQRETGGGFWGAVLVAREGRVVLARGYGNADYGLVPNGPRSLFEIASLSKQFTAAAILRLEEAGRLRTDDPVSRFFPDAPAGVTAPHLVAHTSGLSPEVGLPYASTATRGEMAAHALAGPFDSPPGERFAYCNAGYALLAGIVEVASGRPFERYLEEELFEPAGMADTGFVGDADLDRSRVTARLADGVVSGTAADWAWGWGYRGMGGVVTTAYDLLAWDRSLREGKVLRPEALAKFHRPIAEGYAYGWFTGAGTVEHGGGVAGYGCHMTRWLEVDAVAIVLSNGRTDPRAVTRAIRAALFPLAASIDASPYDLGEFQAVTIARGLEWVVDGSRLLLRDGSRDHVLAAVTLPPGGHLDVAAKLEAAIRAGDDESAGVAGGVYLGGYELAGKRLDLAGTIDFLCLPKYEGVGEDGRPVEDPRVVLVLADSARGQWPILTHVDRAAAADLARRLREAPR